MPEITSVFVLPAAPAAPNAAAAGVGAPAISDPGAVAADFLSQFKAAIKNLASAALPQLATPPVLAASVSEPDTTPALPTDTKNADAKQSELMPEILATLGFVVVPPVLQPLTAVQPPVSDSGSPAAAVAVTGSSAWPASAQAPQPSAVTAPRTSLPPDSVDSLLSSQAHQSPPPPPAPQLGQAQAAPAPTPLLDRPQPTPSPQLDFAAPASASPLDVPPQLLTQLTAAMESRVTEQSATTQALTSDTPSATPTVVTTQLTQPDPSVTTVVAPRITVIQDAPIARHEAPPAPVADSVTPLVATQPGSTFQQSGFDSSSRQPHSAPLVESVSGTTPAQAAPEVTFAVPTAVATPGAAPLPPDVRPSEVVNQIADQADLYRVPGDRSVRIQLHPEGLGGVDVTLRYSVASGIQLHLNVEHASTGALVQAGWTELRDALATQGIHSDRLVMSISAPANASGLDFSNGNGSNRSDGGLSSFTQGQTSQQRQEAQEQRAARGWTAALDPILPSSVDASPRVAPPSAGRIDYRV